MQQSQRFISVACSLSAIGFLALFGILGCGETGRIPYDEKNPLYPNVKGENAFQHVEKLVGFGSRYAGTPELEASRVYIIEELAKLGWKTERQTFEARTPEGRVTFVNLIARFGDSAGQAPKGILCSHYDTKKFSFEFVGANDAGSSTGLLIEMARVLSTKPNVADRIELVFFDGEEAFGTNITELDGLYGSKYYANQLVVQPLKNRPHWGVLLDMVGDKDLNVRAAFLLSPDIRSLIEAQKEGIGVDIQKVQDALTGISKDLIAAAEMLDLRSKVGVSTNIITDDHIPLNMAAGIPTIDIIDFDYDPWHTPADSLDKISAESLETVGQVSMLLIEKYLLPKGRRY